MLIGLFLAIFSFYLLGLSALILLFNPKKVDLFDWGAIFGLGFAGAGLLLMVFTLFSVPFSPFLFLVTSCCSLITVYFLKGPKFKKICLPQWRKLDLLLVGFFSLFLFSLFLKTFSYPIWGYDAYTIWLSRSRAFFVDGALNLQNINWFYPAEHPPLWSFLVSWVYIFLGTADNLLIRFLPFLIYILIIITFLKEAEGSKLLKLIFFLFLVTLPQLIGNVIRPDIAGNADLLVSFYFFLSVIAISKRQFSRAGLFLGLASWVKSDISPAAIIFILLLFILAIKKKIKPILGVMIPLLVLFLIKFSLGISSRYFHLPQARPWLSHIWYDVMSFREEFRQIKDWHLLWWLYIFTILVSFKKMLKQKHLLFANLLVIGQIASCFLIFLITPEDQAGHIASALFRLLLHVAPSVLFLTYLQIESYLVTTFKP